jgi:D-lactate dehydrogenase (cytochrome)
MMSRMAERSNIEAFSRLAEFLGERFVTSRAVREEHGRDESPLPEALPDAVAFPETEDEIARILRVCSEFRVPVIPFGAGTSLEGHVLAMSDGISINLTRLNDIVAVHVDDLDVTVQAGVTRKQLNERLRREGLFFPVDPGADATLGGMASTGASGTTTVRYGAMRENVLSLRVVLPSGEVIHTGRRARKTSAGYDLTRLFVGSEGTLGIITEMSLRVFGIPEAISAAVVSFATIEAAIQAVIATLQLGIPVARVEFLDEMGMKAVSAHSALDYPVGPTLFFEFHGSRTGVAQDTDYVQEIATEHGATEFRSAVDGQERTRLWRARHDHFYASLALRPGSRAVTTDVCVPISNLAECVLETRRDIETTSLLATMAGHVGDGNFHVMFVIDPENSAEMATAEDINERLVDRALTMGGTCTGEHGIGVRKIPSLEREMGPALDVMRSIKNALDPYGIMNPGKVLADPE